MIQAKKERPRRNLSCLSINSVIIYKIRSEVKFSPSVKRIRPESVSLAFSDGLDMRCVDTMSSQIIAESLGASFAQVEIVSRSSGGIGVCDNSYIIAGG